MSANADRLTALRAELVSENNRLLELETAYGKEQDDLEAELERAENDFVRNRLVIESGIGDILDEIRALGGDE